MDPSACTTVSADWIKDSVNHFHAIYENNGAIDEVTARKAFNKDETSFLRSFVSHAMTAIDTRLQNHFKEEDARMESMCATVRNLVETGVPITAEERDSLLTEIVPACFSKTYTVYLYESDLEALIEKEKLNGIGKGAGSGSAFQPHTVRTRAIDAYMIRIAKRIVAEWRLAFDIYAQAVLPMCLRCSLIDTEYLGALKTHRASTATPTEGDYVKNLDGTQQAYNEIRTFDYCFSGKEWQAVLRQRTVKFSTTVCLNLTKVSAPRAIYEIIARIPVKPEKHTTTSWRWQRMLDMERQRQRLSAQK